MPNTSKKRKLSAEEPCQRDLPFDRTTINCQDTVTVKVGIDEAIFVVPRAALCCNSPFFRTALSNEWLEGQTSQIHLPEDTPDIIGLYVEWAVHGGIHLSLPDAPAPTDLEYYVEDLFELFVFADKVGNSILQNRIMDKLEAFRNRPDPTTPKVSVMLSAANRVYEGSKLRLWILDEMVYRTVFRSADGAFVCENAVLVAELLKRFNIVMKFEFANRTKCTYHTHEYSEI